jgi:hypothetical protein
VFKMWTTVQILQIPDPDLMIACRRVYGYIQFCLPKEICLSNRRTDRSIELVDKRNVGICFGGRKLSRKLSSVRRFEDQRQSAKTICSSFTSHQTETSSNGRYRHQQPRWPVSLQWQNELSVDSDDFLA